MGILIAAAITSLVAILAVGYLIRRISTPADYGALLLGFLYAVPAQPVAFYYIRLPLHELLNGWIGAGALLTAITLFYAPLTEEPAKWLALGVPSLRKTLRPQNAVAIALAVGLGFGVGEIWFLAARLYPSPQIAALPFWAFTGFLGERLMVCFIHGALIALFFKRYAENRSILFPALLGIALHFALNFPIYLSSINLGGFGAETWGILIALYLAAMTLALLIFVNRLSVGRMEHGLLGKADCPECGKEYSRSFLALNLLTVRYERCPHCRKFHFVPMNQPPRDNSDKA